MDRRRFLQHAATAALATPALSVTTRLYAAPASSPRFLLVFLRGGYDCNNLLVPYRNDFYYEARPTLAIAQPRGGDPHSAIALDSDWALSPVVKDSLLPLWQKKQLAFVPFAGTADLSRSHFETQDHIERGEPMQDNGHYRSGFMGRLASQLQHPSPIAFTRSLPLSFQGSGRDIPNLSLRGNPRSPFDDRESALLSSMYQGTPWAQASADGLALRKQVSQDLQHEMIAASRGAPGARSFASETQRIATLMRERYRLGFVDVGGWDTHVNQGSVTGGLANNLRNLGEGLAAFAQAMGPAWNDTVVVVLSEFGRTFHENGDHGTDHGHGTVYWVLGGGIRGGRIVGEQLNITPATLVQHRDYPVLNPYRDVLAGLLGPLWGLGPQHLQAVFPKAQPRALQLV